MSGDPVLSDQQLVSDRLQQPQSAPFLAKFLAVIGAAAFVAQVMIFPLLEVIVDKNIDNDPLGIAVSAAMMGIGSGNILDHWRKSGK